MQQSNKKTVDMPKQAEPFQLLKKIGSTNYVVNVYFSKTSKETMSDKIIRLIEREASGQ